MSMMSKEAVEIPREAVKAARKVYGIAYSNVDTAIRTMLAAALPHLRAALSAQPVQGEAKPVAWRVRDWADGWILFHSEEEARREQDGSDRPLEPLYAAPQPKQPAPAQEGDVEALLDEYWSLAFAEGLEGRSHDNEAGDAQRVRHQLSAIYRSKQAPTAAVPSQAVEAGEDALKWYADQVAGCRRIGTAGDPFRQALDRDGGERARSALRARAEQREALRGQP